RLAEDEPGSPTWLSLRRLSRHCVLVAVIGSPGAARRHRGIRITDARQVGRARLSIQLLKQTVVARIFLQLRDLRVRVVDVAERDGLRRTHLLTGGLDLVVADRTSGFLSRR